MRMEVLRRQIVSAVATYLHSLRLYLKAADLDILAMCRKIRHYGVEGLIVCNTLAQGDAPAALQIVQGSLQAHIRIRRSAHWQPALPRNVEHILYAGIGKLHMRIQLHVVVPRVRYRAAPADDPMRLKTSRNIQHRCSAMNR